MQQNAAEDAAKTAVDTAKTIASTDLTSATVGIVSTLVLLIISMAVIAVFGYMLFQWWKHRNREAYALDFVTLLIRLPKDNEIKIELSSVTIR